MKIFVSKEPGNQETRIAMVPSIAEKLVDLGGEVQIESSLGEPLHFTDEDYEKVGATISKNREEDMKKADMVVRLNKPPLSDIHHLKEGCVHVSYLEPFEDLELLKKLAAQKVTAISMEMMPRTTIAQKMDSLSSQASLAGYIAVILAAERINKIFPMMVTPAGTISPGRVFIVGAGVAGLQAIATAKRLGARVDAFDTRPEVEDQVKSVGGKFVKIDLGKTEADSLGRSKGLSEEQIKKQRAGMLKICARSDVVITTAQVFGRKAPLIITKEMVSAMKPGSVLVDLAVDTGGNIEGSKLGEEVIINGVRIIGLGNFPGLVPLDASTMYASNLYNLLSHFWNKDDKVFELKKDEILFGNKEKNFEGCIVVRGGEIVSPWLRKVHGLGELQEPVEEPKKDDSKEEKADDSKDDSKEGDSKKQKKKKKNEKK